MQAGRSPPAGEGWAHEVKFDGYRVQARVVDGALPMNPQGLGLDNEFPPIAKAARNYDCIIDGEIVALDQNGAPDFAGLQAALSEGKTDELMFFTFDLMFEAGEDCGPGRCRSAKAR